MTLLLLSLSGLLAGAVWWVVLLYRYARGLEAQLRRERARGAELAEAAAVAYVARRSLEARVRGRLPPELAEVVLADHAVRVHVERVDSPGELAHVIPLRRPTTTKH